MNFSTPKAPIFKHPISGKLLQKKAISLHCSYDNNYQEIYEPMYDQNIIFYNEEEFDFDLSINDNSTEFYEA